ncbi:MAG: hypothetical protein ACKVQU_15465 [Burkholderiales bacterium]
MRLTYSGLVYHMQRLARPLKRLYAIKRPGEPVSREFGLDRGTSLDRYWIERYLAQHASTERGSALEVGETTYLERFFPNFTGSHLELADDGTPNCVVIDLDASNPSIEPRFDLMIATQVYNFVYETRAAIRNTAALLKPGGVLIGSVGGITQISRHDADRWGHYFSFTAQSWERLLREAFAEVSIESFGNVDTACAFLNGLAMEEIDRDLLNRHDPDYPVSICFKAVKARG